MPVALRNNLLKIDPSRTTGIRKAFQSDLLRRVESVRRDIINLVMVEDAFGLRSPDLMVLHFNPYHEPGGSRIGGEFAHAPGGTATKEKGEVVVEDEDGEGEFYNSALAKRAAKATGVNKDNVHEMLGVPIDANIKITYVYGPAGSIAGVRARGDDPEAGRYFLEREYKATSKYGKLVYNENFSVEHPGSGFGVKVFSNQVKAAAKAGYEYIETDAARSSKHNGYYTWPRLGYDAELTNESFFGLDFELWHEKFPEAARVSDFMKTKEGREFWKEHGTNINVSFDLKEGSLSRKVLDAYVKEKQSRTATTTNEGRRGDTGRDLGLILNTRWKGLTNLQKIKFFREWIDQQVKTKILTTNDVKGLWTEKYIKQAYDKGLSRGLSEAAAARREQFSEFLQSEYFTARKREVHVARSLEDLRGFTQRLTTKATRIITDGLEHGDGPATIARRLNKELGIEKARAKTIARTEVIKAQSEAQLDAYEAYGIKQVGAVVEWVTAAGPGASAGEMDSVGVCKQCQSMSGVVLTIKEARGLIPRHPNCRCAWFPVTEDTPTKGLVKSVTRIRAAIKRSVGKQKKSGWLGASRRIAKRR